MIDSATTSSILEYEVVLVSPYSEMIFAVLDGNSLRLPRVHIPKWTRPAEEITRELREKWNLNTVVLNLFPSNDSQPMCAVAEVLETQNSQGPPRLCLSNVRRIARTELDGDEQDRVFDVLYGGDKTVGPFSRAGWIKEAKLWIQKSLPDRRIDFEEEFRQYNAGETFALVRFGTHGGPAYWLKATGAPNKEEFSVTAGLSQLFPKYLPRLVARREDWNAWVTEDAGEPLGCVQDPKILALAVEALADLQIMSLDHVSRLETIGCMNRSLKTIHSHLPEMITFLEEAMVSHTSTKVKSLAPSRLREIGSIVDEACAAMRGLDVPDSLINGDINLDNILNNKSHFRIIDWAEAGTGNPFLMLQQMIQHVIRDGEHLGWVSGLREAYKNKWLSVLRESQIDQAFALMPLLTMISYLYGRGDWLHSSRRGEQDFQGFARTLARYMDRAASDPTLLKALRP